MKLNRISINCSLYNKGKITVAGASNSSGGYIYNDGSFEITGKTTFAMSGKATFVNSSICFIAGCDHDRKL